jgi:uncharacterized membrane protein YeaQ/YmgE (transglycosylase-associated protein family)
MSPAQLLIVLIGLVVSFAAFALMRFPSTRREQYRGEAFSMRASLIGAAMVLALCLFFAWAQGQYESR